MVTLETLLVKIGIDPKGLQKGLNKAQAKLNAFGNSAKKVGSTFTKFVTVPIATGAALAVRSFAIQEDAVNDLTAALSNTGEATDDNIQSFRKFASGIQKVTKFGDEALLGQIAFAKNLGVQTKDLKKATTAAIGLSAAFKIDLQTAFNLIGRASKGQTSLLTRYGIILDDTGTDQEKFNQLLEIGASKFGLAEAQAKTTSGALTQMRNAVGDLLEVIGAQLAPLVVKAANAIKRMAEQAQRINPEILKMGTIIAGIAAAIGPILIAIGSLAVGFAAMLPFITKGVTLFIKFVPVLKGFALTAGLVVIKVLAVIAVFAAAVAATRFLMDNMRSLGAFMESIWNGIKSTIFTIIAAILRKFEDIPLIGDSFKGAADDLEKSALASLNKFIDKADEAAAANVKFGDSMKGLAKDLKPVSDAIKGFVLAPTAAPAAPEDGEAPGGGIDPNIARAKELINQLNLLRTKNAEVVSGITQDWFGFQTNFATGFAAFREVTSTAFTQFKDGFGQAVADAVVFGQDFLESIKKLGEQVAATIIKTLVKIGIERATQAVVGAAVGKASAIASIQSSAAQAGAAAFAATAGIPIVGPALAPGAAASAFGGALSFVAAAAKGGVVDQATLLVAGEAGPEAIIPLSSSRANNAMGGGEQRIMVFLDSRVLTETVVKGMPQIVRANAGVRL